MEFCMRSGRSKPGKNILFENDDILTEILIRLPMKTKVLCKSVCNHWFSIISCTYFANRVISRENNPPWDFLYKSRYSKRLQVAFGHYPELNSQNLKLGSLFTHLKIELVGADNGLILGANFEKIYRGHCKYYVCNPITGQWVSLPKPPLHEKDETVLVGFRVSCLDGITTYKVVRAIYNSSSLLSKFEVFSSDVGEWRDTSVCVSLPGRDSSLFVYDRFTTGVTYNGIIHWLCRVTGSIMAYEPDKNKLRFIKMPSNLLYPAYGRIGMSCGSLCYIHKDFSVPQLDENEETLSIWALDNYDTEECRLVLKTTFNNTLEIHQILFSFVFHPFDMNVMYWEASDAKMASFNLQTQKLTSVRENFLPCFYPGECSVYPYVIPPLPTPVPPPIW